MDDKTIATFPDFKPQPAMFEGQTSAPEPSTPTPPETGKKRRGRPPRTTAPDTPTANVQGRAKTSRKGRPRGQRRTMPASVTETTPTSTPKKRGRKPGVTRQMQVAVSALPALVGLKPDELSALLQFADAIKVFGKRGRERIATALGRLV